MLSAGEDGRPGPGDACLCTAHVCLHAPPLGGLAGAQAGLAMMRGGAAASAAVLRLPGACVHAVGMWDLHLFGCLGGAGGQLPGVQDVSLHVWARAKTRLCVCVRAVRACRVTWSRPTVCQSARSWTAARPASARARPGACRSPQPVTLVPPSPAWPMRLRRSTPRRAAAPRRSVCCCPATSTTAASLACAGVLGARVACIPGQKLQLQRLLAHADRARARAAATPTCAASLARVRRFLNIVGLPLFRMFVKVRSGEGRAAGNLFWKGSRRRKAGEGGWGQRQGP